MTRILIALFLFIAAIGSNAFANEGEESSPTLPPVHNHDRDVEEMRKYINDLCGVEEGSSENPLLCFIEKVHEFREQGSMCEDVYRRLLREGEMKIAFRRGFEEGLRHGQEMCDGRGGKGPREGKPGDGDRRAKVTVCHIPPGNPDNAHTIEISREALSAHLAHGDSEGPCSDDDNGRGDKEKSPEKKPEKKPKKDVKKSK